ncbi:class I SAM-dependent DNA methyltransferase [Amycolatopsis sp. NPDC005003]
MFDKLAAVYDLIYRARGKDYHAEALAVADLVRTRHPGATSLLDVASGTGEHLRTLREHFADVEGLELSPSMLAITKEKLPDVLVHALDMRDFTLDRRFDAVTCLFGSIGYMRTTAELTATIGRMAAHLHPGGVLVVEPWWFPERYIDRYVGCDVVRDGDRAITRVSRTVRQNGTTRMEIHCLVADPDGIEHFTETHLHTPFTREDYVAAFTAAGCTSGFVPGPPFTTGVFAGVRTA